jgi:hypothetical protein
MKIKICKRCWENKGIRGINPVKKTMSTENVGYIRSLKENPSNPYYKENKINILI